MNIICTKKLEKYLGKNLSEAAPKEAPLLGTWNANLFTLKRKNWIIVMHSKTYYPVLLMGVKKTDLPNFQLLFCNRLIEQMTYDGIKVADPLQHKLLDDATPNFCPSDNNRKALGMINRYIKETEIRIDYVYGGKMESHLLTDLNHNLTNSWTGALKPKKHDYGMPLEEMKKLIEGDNG